MKRLPHPTRRKARGIATLAVVMVLLFIASMVAAYTSRNLIFEQRTANNQYRSTQALEAAEAGLEWAISMLNSGRIDATCQATNDTSATSFRERYLNIDPVSGSITAKQDPASPASPPAASPVYLFPTCVWSGGTWSCACPAQGTAMPTSGSTGDVAPAFRVGFRTVAGQVGVVQLFANGCTRLNNDCLKFDPAMGFTPELASLAVGAVNEGAASVSVVLGLAGGLSAPPIAPLTVKGTLSLGGGGTVSAYNEDESSGGRTVRAGGAVSLSSIGSLRGPNGEQGSNTLADGDTSLAALGSAPSTAAQTAGAADTTPTHLYSSRMFPALFNMWPITYKNQQAAVVLACDPDTPSACTIPVSAVRAALAVNPDRPIWVNGDLRIDSVGDVGSTAAPALVNVSGSVSVTASGVTVTGLLYVQADDWTTSGTLNVRGAAVAQGDVSGTGTMTLTYDAAALKHLRARTGSFVRVPGSWKDFP